MEVKTALLLGLLCGPLFAADWSPSAELLARASRLGDLPVLQKLLSSGISPDQPDRFGTTPIYYAASFNQTKAVELLLAAHANPNQTPGRHSIQPPPPATPLQYSAELGNVAIASLLLAAGARVDEKGPTGRTALHFAIGHADMLQLLIAKGADPNARDLDGISPLDDAVWFDISDSVATLLKNGAHLNESEPKTGATPVNEAAFKGQLNLLHYLLDLKPDLSIPDKKGYRPLDNAIRMGHEDAALLLLAADSNPLPLSGANAMDAAVAKDESKVVDRLLQTTASPDAPLPSGSTPLDAAAFDGSRKVVSVLLSHHANPNISGPNGNSPLEDASLKGFQPIVEALLDGGALIDRIGESSHTTALYSAASFGKADIVQLLLARGADPNLCGSNGKTPYRAALENGFNDIAAQIHSRGGTKACQSH